MSAPGCHTAHYSWNTEGLWGDIRSRAQPCFSVLRPALPPTCLSKAQPAGWFLCIQTSVLLISRNLCCRNCQDKIYQHFINAICLLRPPLGKRSLQPPSSVSWIKGTVSFIQAPIYLPNIQILWGFPNFLKKKKTNISKTSLISLSPLKDKSNCIGVCILIFIWNCRSDGPH